jgi:hypothetical protein
MRQVTINEVVKTVEDDVAAYLTGLEQEVRNALKDAEAAKAAVPALEQKVLQAVADGETRVKAAETKVMGWVEARAHSFFMMLDGDFRNVRGFLQHLTAGLEPHMQPQTLTMAPVTAPAQSITLSVGGPASTPSSPAAPAPAAPAPAAEAAAPSAPAQGS